MNKCYLCDKANATYRKSYKAVLCKKCVDGLYRDEANSINQYYKGDNNDNR